MFKYEVIFGPYFSVLGLNTEIYGVEKYGPEITPYFETFHAVSGTESNTKGQVPTTLSHISWVLYRSGRNCITEF